jgi:hypothetical protein
MLVAAAAAAGASKPSIARRAVNHGALRGKRSAPPRKRTTKDSIDDNELVRWVFWTFDFTTWTR